VNEHKNKFKLIHNQLNSGFGTARNIGVRNATGDFVIFLDAADYIECTMLETINKYAKKYRNLEILSYSALWLDDDNQLTKLEQKYDGWQPYTLTNVNLSYNLPKDKVHI
jgi:glycosyltransferase involved in cell wall biosynthesis